MKLPKDFLQFIPKKASHILDVGAGIGRDASEFSNMEHSVVAVEPLEQFRLAGKKLYSSPNIEWINDSLPNLKLLVNSSHRFDFILASGVWHHLDNNEQFKAIIRVTELLNLNGIFALSLRHGPAGAGIHVFETDGEQTKRQAESCGLRTLLHSENQPSIINNKEKVTWTRLVFLKV